MTHGEYMMKGAPGNVDNEHDYDEVVTCELCGQVYATVQIVDGEKVCGGCVLFLEGEGEIVEYETLNLHPASIDEYLIKFQ